MILLALLAAQAAPVVAFPGAEGAGWLSLGGRGGRVIHVTTLADDGPGSLRAAVEAKGPRTVIFDLSGTIALTRELKIREPRITIAGQTAPGDGITLRDHSLVVAADDVVIRYIRSRLGNVSRSQEDAITVTAGRRIILDHVSASWSVDETLSASANYKDASQGWYDLTVQWSIIANSLRRSGHVKGDHGYGSLIRGGRGAKASWHHNLWANHAARMPRPGNYDGPQVDPVGASFDFRSNIFYNWGGTHAGYDADTAALVRYNFIDNVYLPGPDSRGRYAFDESNTLARGYFAGNSMAGQTPADPMTLVKGSIAPNWRLSAPVEVAPVTADPRPLQAVLARAGASRARDAIDTAIIAGVRDGSGRIIDSQDDMGGWPALASRPAPRDTDRDGMPDAWEKAHGLDPAKDDSAGDRNRDGYTNLEDYLDALTRPAGAS
ncbi:pectate lyase [Sphingomonas donggukensis]|uniref:Pectate lyase n=1 Tax=Sphingomonas donggukensis TaxID=2949093 RepID=A0ABY4TVC2_9SPHN|nr:pectate lyase [Sphingomonas donggukensis]URW76350.1 pectate lyase [Sphingomonas donggukensis]